MLLVASIDVAVVVIDDCWILMTAALSIVDLLTARVTIRITSLDIVVIGRQCLWLLMLLDLLMLLLL